jgi:hypothetical protein
MRTVLFFRSLADELHIKWSVAQDLELSVGALPLPKLLALRWVSFISDGMEETRI